MVEKNTKKKNKLKSQGEYILKIEAPVQRFKTLNAKLTHSNYKIKWDEANPRELLKLKKVKKKYDISKKLDEVLRIKYI